MASARLFVGNIPLGTTKAAVVAACVPFVPALSQAAVKWGRSRSKSKKPRYAYVTLAEAEAARGVELDGQLDVGGSKLIIARARPGAGGSAAARTVAKQQQQPEAAAAATTAVAAMADKAQAQAQAHPKQAKGKEKGAQGDGSIVPASVGPLVDIGANLLSKTMQRGLEQLLARSKQAGVEQIVVTSTCMPTSRGGLKLCAKAGLPVQLRPTVGIHPHKASSFSAAALAEMETLAANPLVCAVGETGLDFNRNFSTPEEQIASFEAHVEMACRLQKPMFLHERDAHEEFVKVLDKHAARLPPVVVHCFTGTAAHLAAYVKRGYHIGVTGFIAKKKRGQEVRDCLTCVPLDRLMIETDAPYMCPEGVDARFRKRNEPCTLPVVAQVVATLYDKSAAEIAAQTTANARSFFGLEQPSA